MTLSIPALTFGTKEKLFPGFCLVSERHIYLRRKRARICVRCGNQKSVRKMVMCPACFKTHTQDRLRRSNKLRSLGLCITCGKSPSERGSICENCRERTRKHRAAKRASAAQKLRTREEVNEKEGHHRNEHSARDRSETIRPTGGDKTASGPT
jgi:predicted amidophosphoribosyltransferase